MDMSKATITAAGLLLVSCLGCTGSEANKQEPVLTTHETPSMISNNDRLEDRFRSTPWQAIYRELDRIDDPSELASAYGELEGSLRLHGQTELADALASKHRELRAAEDGSGEKLEHIRGTQRALYQVSWQRREQEHFDSCSPLQQTCLSASSVPREVGSALLSKVEGSASAYQRALLSKRYRYARWAMFEGLLGVTSALEARADRVGGLLDAITIAQRQKRLHDVELLLPWVQAQILGEKDARARAKLWQQYTSRMFALSRRDDARFGLYYLDRIDFPVEDAARVLDFALFSCESHQRLGQRAFARAACRKAYRSFLESRVYDEHEASLFELSLELGMHRQTWELANLHPDILRSSKRVELLVRAHLDELPEDIAREVSDFHVSRELALISSLAELRAEVAREGKISGRTKEAFAASRREVRAYLDDFEIYEAMELRFELARTRAVFKEGKMPTLAYDLLEPLREDDMAERARGGMMQLASAFAAAGQEKEALFVLGEALDTIPLREPSKTSDFAETWESLDIESTVDAIMKMERRALFLPMLFASTPPAAKKRLLELITESDTTWTEEEQAAIETIMKTLASSPHGSQHILGWMMVVAKSCKTSPCLDVLEQQAVGGANDRQFGDAMKLLMDARIERGEVAQAWDVVTRIPLPTRRFQSGMILLRSMNQVGLITPRPRIDAYRSWLDASIDSTWGASEPLVTGLLLRGECEEALDILAAYERIEGDGEVFERAVVTCYNRAPAVKVNDVIAHMDSARKRVHYKLMVLEGGEVRTP